MSHFGKFIAALFMMMSIAGCTQSGSNDQASTSGGNRIMDATPDPLCELNGTNPFYIANGTTVVQCPITCADGSHIQCTAVLQEEVVCQNDQMVPTGKTKAGEVISPIGQCEPTSADCGSHPAGTTWWTDTSTANTTCDVCADGTPHTCEVNVQTQYQCSGGVISATGQTQNGSIITYTNECLPTPASCGPYQSGSTWWQVTGQSNDTCGTCWDNSSLICNYQDSVQETCTNGVISQTGQTQHQQIGQVNSCPAQPPQSCGSTPSGSTIWQPNGQTAPVQCDTCLDGTPHMCYYELDQQMLCTNGTLSPTGQTQNGQILGYTNTCPNVKQASETYQVPTAAPKADVMFVIDTTPVMFKTIEELGNRLGNLISSWNNVDWQIGIANADVTPNHSRYHTKVGDLLELNPFPNTDIKGPLTILTKNTRDNDIIFSRNLSFNGLGWAGHDDPDGGDFCDQQPYCSLGPAEPMREILNTFTHRTDKENAKFFRAGATFVPIIVSATDERYSGPKNPHATQPSAVMEAFAKNFPAMAGMKAYSIVIQPGDKKCLEQFSSIFAEGSQGVYGQSLKQFADATGGYSISICQNDYSKSLANLSQVIRQEVSSILLQAAPYNAKVDITFSPAIPGISWTVQGNKVIFNKPLPAGTALAISYLVQQ